MKSIRDLESREELIEFLNRGNAVEYVFFWGHRKPKTGVSKTCLSQWHAASFEVDGVRYRTAEHYMMAEKARLFEDWATAAKIVSCETPKEAQRLGREVAGFDSSVWDDRKFDIVVNGNIAKFGQNPGPGEFLKGTGNKVLVEASPDDRIWGIGLAANHPSASDPNLWDGISRQIHG